LYESLVLLEYLDDAFPSSPLRPTDPLERGRARLAAEQVSNVVVPAFYKYVQAQDPSAQEEGKKAFVEALQELVKAWFLPSTVFARSDTFSWVDVVLAPWIERFPLLEHHRGFVVSEVGGRFEEYAKKVRERESVRKTSSTRESYEKVYRRYFEDTAESEVAKATRKGEWLK
jgi:glutathione S-transferase